MDAGKPMEILIIHTGTHDRVHLFSVEHNGKREATVPLTRPNQDIVPGRPTSNLQKDLQWYLENFLDLPTGEYIDLSGRVMKETERWGRECFDALFQNQAFVWYQKAIDKGLDNLHIRIVSDDPLVLAWPWEALRSDRGYLAHLFRTSFQNEPFGDDVEGLSH